MIKFIWAGRNADSEELIEYVNRFILLGEKNSSNDAKEYLPILVDNMRRVIQETNLLYQVNLDVPVESDSKIKKLVKAPVKKLVNWYLNSIMNQQIEFNANAVRSLNEQMELIGILCERNFELENQINNLKEQLLQVNGGKNE